MKRALNFVIAAIGGALGCGQAELPEDDSKVLNGKGKFASPRWRVTPVQEGNYAASPGDLVQTDTTFAPVDIELPQANACKGQSVRVKNLAYVERLRAIPKPDGGDSIDGDVEFNMSVNQCNEFTSDGVSRWHVLIRL